MRPETILREIVRLQHELELMTPDLYQDESRYRQARSARLNHITRLWRLLASLERKEEDHG